MNKKHVSKSWCKWKYYFAKLYVGEIIRKNFGINLDDGLTFDFRNIKEIKQKINDFHGEDIIDDMVIFRNPYTMQIILSHLYEIKLTSQSKTINSNLGFRINYEKFINL